MESEIVRWLEPELAPVALVWSDEVPAGAVQPRPGKFVCILNLFAETARTGRITGGGRETICCSGGRAALGLGDDLISSRESMEHYATVFSKGLAVAPDPHAHRRRMDAARPSWRPLYELGERRHSSRELAAAWLEAEMPRYSASKRFTLFKRLSDVAPADDVRVVIFLVNAVELAGLVTLVGSVLDGTDAVKVPQGADCFRIAGFACSQKEPALQAVLGMLDVDGREVMRRRFHDGVVTLALPAPLFQRVEREAHDSVLQTPGWKRLKSGSS
jgi:Uncharacterised ArCR, COG2043